MDIEIWQKFLCYCTKINVGILLLWLVAYIFMGQKIYSIHSKWFKISLEQFHAFNYTGMGMYKMVIVFFNLIPCMVLYCMKSA